MADRRRRRGIFNRAAPPPAAALMVVHSAWADAAGRSSGAKAGGRRSIIRRPIMDFLLSAHEINLKGQNRGFFSTRLRMNVESLLEGTGSRIRVAGSALHVSSAEEQSQEVRRRLNFALGVQRILPAVRVANDIEAISAAALETIAGQQGESFALEVRRQDKRMPFTSYELAVRAGRFIQDRLGLRVDLKQPARRCRIVCTRAGAFVSRQSERGPGGMPAMTAGRLLALVSAGFDSPVAAFRLIRRGAKVALVHFYGTPAMPGESSRLTVDEIARALTQYQLGTTVHFCHFEPLQVQIVMKCAAEYRVLLYRRMMLRVAARIAIATNCHGLITGDSLGQVASQTLRNLEAVSAAVRLPIYRPLIGDDKVQIMNEARALGTFDYSAENPQDCCSAFMPPHPALSSSAAELDAAEAALDVDALVDAAVENIETRRYRWLGGRVEAVESKQPIRAVQQPA
jgi:thiamine biosynthesis protein ThiI